MQKKKDRKHFLRPVLVLMSSLVIFTGFADRAAAAEYSTEVENNIETGLVSIHLDQYEYDSAGKLLEYEDCQKVRPGARLNRLIHISNKANSAWIRLKISLKTSDTLFGFGEEMLTGMNKGWIRRGAYYYWTKPLDKGEGVYFDNSLLIPASWSEADVCKEFQVSVSADAVQTKNYSPDFDSEDPWFGTVIEQSLYDSYEEKEAVQNNFAVIFKGGAEGLVKTGKDFFSGWGTLMPGDTVHDEVTISSSYSAPVKIWFYTNTQASDRMNDLADKVRITIRDDSSVIYEGPLSGTVDKVLLGEYTAGSTGKISYSVYVPKELTNRYSLANARTVWVFECEVLEEPGRPPEESGNPPGESGGDPEEPGTTTGTGKTAGPVKTGDFNNYLPYILMTAAAFGVLFVICVKSTGRKSKKHNKNRSETEDSKCEEKE